VFHCHKCTNIDLYVTGVGIGGIFLATLGLSFRLCGIVFFWGYLLFQSSPGSADARLPYTKY